MLPFQDRDGFLWLDGALVPWAEGQLHVLTHALHMGGAVHEGIRAYGGRMFLADAHMQRLARSAELLGYRIPRPARELLWAAEAVLWVNELDDAYIRIVAWRGSESVAVAAPQATVHIAIAAWVWPTQAVCGAEPGVRLRLTEWRRPDPRTVPAASKCAAFSATATLARHEALSAGCDDALMLDVDGHVATTTATNIVLVRGGTLLAPAPACHVDSLTKRHVFRLARRRGLEIEERAVTLDDLRSADEVFIAGTAVELRPVVELREDCRRSAWPAGPVTAALIADFHASVRHTATATVV